MDNALSHPVPALSVLSPDADDTPLLRTWPYGKAPALSKDTGGTYACAQWRNRNSGTSLINIRKRNVLMTADIAITRYGGPHLIHVMVLMFGARP